MRIINIDLLMQNLGFWNTEGEREEIKRKLTVMNRENDIKGCI